MQLFLQSRKENDSKVFCFPQNFEQLGIMRHIWENVERQDQMIFDLRPDEEKKNQQKFREPFTFETNLNVWREKPQLINRESVPVKNWRPSVHFIDKQNVIIFIALAKKWDFVNIIFYNADNFYQLQRIKVKRYQFECAMVVNEISKEVKQNKESFTIALFKVQMDPDLCTFVKLIQKNEKEWEAKVAEVAEESLQITKTEKNYALSKMMNAYQTQLDQIVCITQIRCLLFDQNLKQQSAKPILENKFKFIDGVQVFEIGQKEDFLICCQVNEKVFKE